MTLSPAFLDELRARTSLSSLIGRTLKLQKAGNEHKACCPFHQEKTPSFYVNDEKGFYHCFGCQAHGDAIRWLTDARGLGFMDSVKELADAAGMEVPAPDPRSQARAERATGLFEVMEAAQNWFAEQLDSIEGQGARDYLSQRGMEAQARLKFGFGFAPDTRGRLKSALNRFGDEQLVEAGLLIQPEEEDGRSRPPYDRFRGRLTFPIRDARGRVIAFSARIIGPGEPKYLNSPDTPLFDKGRTLFNLDLAGPASRRTKRVLVVEGQMDAIALDQAGIEDVVAPLGTALTDTQLALLWKLAPTPLLCFDGDSAGQKAAIRAALRALPHVGPGRSLGFVRLPPGKDPDDLVRAGGRSAFEDLLEDPEPLVDRLWRHEIESGPLRTPEEKAGLRRRLIDHVSVIADQDVRDAYRTEFLNRLHALNPAPSRRPWSPGSSSGPFSGPFPGSSRGASGRRFAPLSRPTSEQAKAIGRGGLDPQLGHAVLQGLARFPALIGSHAEAIAALPLSGRKALRLRDLMIEAAMTNAELDQSLLNTILADEGAAALMEELSLKRGLAFSFTRRDSDEVRACRDLALVIETLAARPGMEAALEAATMRLKEQGDEAAFHEQQRLREAKDEADRQLATLIESEAD